MKSPSDLARGLFALRRIRQSNHPLRNLIFRAYLLTILPGRFDSKKGIVNLFGRPFKFLDERQFVYLFHEIFVKQEYFFSTETSAPFILDCGSNIGLSMLYFKLLYPQSEIICFEPDERTFQCLEANARTLPGVICKREALADYDGQITFYYDQNSPGNPRMSTLKTRMPGQSQTVTAKRLSRYLDREVDFLKLDVEGAETDIIQELVTSETIRKIKWMAIEYHHHLEHDADCFSQILRHLEDNGFGYQIRADVVLPVTSRHYQDLIIYAYRK